MQSNTSADPTGNSQSPVDDDTVLVQSNTDISTHLVDLPTITANDYLQDAEFKYMFQYLRNGDLTDNDDQDRLTLLMADQYLIENDALYRLSTPRNKEQDRLRTHDVRLCIPCHLDMISLVISMTPLDTWEYRDCF